MKIIPDKYIIVKAGARIVIRKNVRWKVMISCLWIGLAMFWAIMMWQLAVIFLFVFLGYMFLKGNGVLLEIDETLGIIKLRDYASMSFASIKQVRIAHVKSGDDTYQYFQLVDSEENVWNVFQIHHTIFSGKESESEKLARFIADKLNLELIIEGREPFSFCNIFSQKSKSLKL